MKRFYSTVAVAEWVDGFAITLDDRPVKTPQRNQLQLPRREMADAIAREWAEQGDKIDPATMPITALAQGALDQVANDRGRIIDQVAAYGESDMLCYRAGPDQAELAAEQARRWDPLLDWARERYDISFAVVDGIMHEEQPEASLQRLREAVAAQDDFALAAMLKLVGLAGSLVIVLALVEGAFAAETLWPLAILEELWQADQWGEDAVAAERRAAREAEWTMASEFLALARP